MNPAPLLIVVALIGCDHTSPFGPEPLHVGMHPAFPDQMTLSPHADQLQGHAWLGDEVFYTFCDDLKAERTPPCGAAPGSTSLASDRCLGALPAQGGGRTVSLCPGPARDADSIQVYHTGTRLDDGSLIYVYSSRMWAASFATNHALYRLRPGAQQPERLRTYPFVGGASTAPGRVFAAGPQRIYAGGALIEIAPDGGLTSRSIPSLIALDAWSATGLVRMESGLHSYDLETDDIQPFAEIPAPEGWLDVALTGVSLTGNTVVISQWGLTPVGATFTTHTRLVVLRPGAAPVVLSSLVVVVNQEFWSNVSVAPDEQTVVAQLGGDLYRIALP